MPNALTHSILTQAALSLMPFDTGDNAALIADFCNYPDHAEAEKFDHPTDGIQFHYLPDSSLNELYRYWHRENGSLRQCRAVNNENFHHALAGFSRYMDLALTNFANRNDETGRQYLGWLIHVLEDASFGLHSLEGFLGSDPFILDRLSGFPVSVMLAKIQLLQMPPLPEYTPQFLGSTPAEASMRLYRQYCLYSADSRQCCFRYAISKLYGGGDADKEIRKMFDNAVKLTADAIFTVFSLAQGKIPPHPPMLPLTEIEPFQFPFGGCKGYCYRAYTVGHALSDESLPIPLKIGSSEYADGIAFAAHHEGALRYIIPPEVFSEFTCLIGLHPECSMKNAVTFQIINDGKVIETVVLDKANPSRKISVDMPVNDFGFRYYCSPTSGEVVVIADPLLRY